MLTGKLSIARRAKWEHAHCQGACLLWLSLLHRFRGIGFKSSGTEGRRGQGKSDKCKKTETTLQVSRLTLNGTCVRVTHQCNDCTSCKNSCREPDTNLINFQTGSSSRACSTTSPTGRVRKYETNAQLGRMK